MPEPAVKEKEPSLEKLNPQLKTTATGDQGLNEYADNLDRTTEHLPELQGRQGSLKYRMMSRGDPQVGMILKVHKNPIMSASWDIDMPDDANEIEKKAI